MLRTESVPKSMPKALAAPLTIRSGGSCTMARLTGSVVQRARGCLAWSSASLDSDLVAGLLIAVALNDKCRSKYVIPRGFGSGAASRQLELRRSGSEHQGYDVRGGVGTA